MFKANFEAASKTVELLLYGPIGDEVDDDGVTGQGLAKVLAEHRTANQIDVRINSEGGNAIEGFNIYNLLSRQRARVNTFVDGAALSAASIVMMAGEHIEAADNALIMIHEASSFIAGSAAELRDRADVLDNVSSKIAETYGRRSGLHDAAEFRAMMESETWFTAAGAMEAGLVDSVTGALDIAARYDPKFAHKVPAWAVSRVTWTPTDYGKRMAAAAAKLAKL